MMPIATISLVTADQLSCRLVDLLVNRTPATGKLSCRSQFGATVLGSSARGRFEGDRVTLAGLRHP
jgi:hypothetical protein